MDDPQTSLDDGPFERMQRTVVIITAVAGALSCTFVSLLLLHMASVTVVPFLFHRKNEAVAKEKAGERWFLRKHIGLFMVCLFLSDLAQSISGMMQIRWARAGRVVVEPACTAQAVMLLMGDVGTAWWNAAVALHTFMTLVMRMPLPNLVVWGILVVGWVFVAFLALIGPLAIAGDQPFYGVAGVWCFVTDSYPLARILVHYLPIIVSAGVILILYVVVFFTLRGNLFVSTQPFRMAFHRRSFWNHQIVVAHDQEFADNISTTDNVIGTELTAIAKKMLWYPVAYLTLILPITISRFVSWDNPRMIPQWVWYLGITLLFLSGFVNVVIYTTTRNVFGRSYRRHNVTYSFSQGGGTTDGSGAAVDARTPRRSSFAIAKSLFGAAAATDDVTSRDREGKKPVPVQADDADMDDREPVSVPLTRLSGDRKAPGLSSRQGQQPRHPTPLELHYQLHNAGIGSTSLLPPLNRGSKGWYLRHTPKPRPTFSNDDLAGRAAGGAGRSDSRLASAVPSRSSFATLPRGGGAASAGLGSARPDSRFDLGEDNLEEEPQTAATIPAADADSNAPRWPLTVPDAVYEGGGHHHHQHNPRTSYHLGIPVVAGATPSPGTSAGTESSGGGLRHYGRAM